MGVESPADVSGSTDDRLDLRTRSPPFEVELLDLRVEVLGTESPGLGEDFDLRTNSLSF